MTGADTSEEIADLIGSKRSVISVALCRLSDAGFIERAGVANDGRAGRPYVRWRVRSAGLRTPRSVPPPSAPAARQERR
jgi:predicted transcriptional regulator